VSHDPWAFATNPRACRLNPFILENGEKLKHALYKIAAKAVTTIFEKSCGGCVLSRTRARRRTECRAAPRSMNLITRLPRPQGHQAKPWPAVGIKNGFGGGGGESACSPRLLPNITTKEVRGIQHQLSPFCQSSLTKGDPARSYRAWTVLPRGLMGRPSRVAGPTSVWRRLDKITYDLKCARGANGHGKVRPFC